MDTSTATTPSPSPQSIVESAISSPVETPPESRNPRLLFWLLGGFAVLILGIGVGAFGARFLNQSQNQPQLPPTPTSTPLPSVSPTPEADPTAEWKTYNSAGIAFKFPPNWAADPSGKKISSPGPEIDIVVFGKDDPMYNECMEQRDVKTMNSLTVKHFFHVKGAEACSNPETWKEREIWITKSTGNSYQPGIIYYYKSDEEDSALAYFDQILSTFKFTD